MKIRKTSLLALSMMTAVAFLTVSPFASTSEPAPRLHDGLPVSMPMVEAAPDTTPPAPQQYLIAIFSLGPAWQADKPAHEQLYFKEHSANLRKWREEKKIVLGARYADKGMIVLSAKDEAEARLWLENDPMVVNRLFDLEIYPFNPFYLGCIEKK